MTHANILLRILLALVGAAVLVLGLDVVFGGIRTSGWMGPTDFVDVTHPTHFAVQDNHVRFLGGLFSGLGVVFLSGAFALQTLRVTLMALCAMVCLGGLSRFTTPELSTLMNMAILPSLLAELGLFPLIGIWLFKSGPKA